MTRNQLKAHELTAQLIKRYKNQQALLSLLNCGRESEDKKWDDFQVYASTYSSALLLTKNISAK